MQILLQIGTVFPTGPHNGRLAFKNSNFEEHEPTTFGFLAILK